MSKTERRSRKHQATSSSGGSRTSTRTRAKSRGTGNSSQTAPASFEQIFGKPESDEVQRLRQLEAASRLRLDQLEKQPKPTLALYRVRHTQKVSKERKLLRDIREALAAAGGTETAD